ncbi:MerR family transcriptional regulator [Motiliproteus coralliicola]|uniref:MerR family transcriptional regulator n=1 Tax=Motiliproteus coralliicola TaxID=2283196 RepID=A0A369WQI5_9GAMM|nr:MerR family transcriptional regulator [Motiliproteus coralliicola]RDE22826.1 MerR family transcriptional regulator [Motiliproteus coralliicola]
MPTQKTEPAPPIPDKRYFTIGEVASLCGLKPHVLRYWEQEFEQLQPVKRRGNRRYYQRQDVLLVRQLCHLLYEQGFTIAGARQWLDGEQADDDNQRSQQLIRQTISELEQLLVTLKSV